MLDYKDIIIRHCALSLSGSEIARQLGVSKSGVNDFLRAFDKRESLSYPPSGRPKTAFTRHFLAVFVSFLI